MTTLAVTRALDCVSRMKHALVAMLAIVGPAFAEDLPLNPAVTQETIADTICVPGWAKTQRPSGKFTGRLKVMDHKIPLCLGGAPSDPRNFVLQPWDEADDKDRIEACLARAVCAGKITLDEARLRIWRDWRDAGKRRVAKRKRPDRGCNGGAFLGGAKMRMRRMSGLAPLLTE